MKWLPITRRQLLILFFSMLMLSASASANKYYVATSGGNSNPGTQSSPFRTIRHGISVLRPGDTLLIRGGTYPEQLRSAYDTIPSGTSWSSPIMISAYPGETVVIKPHSGGTIVGLEGSNVQYIIFDGIIFDATNCNFGVSIKYGAHHIRVQNSEIRNAKMSGVLTTSSANHNEFLNLKAYRNGISRYDHGLYLATSYNLVENCDVFENAGYGIHIYNGSDGTGAGYNIVRQNRVYSNGTAEGTSYGIIIGSGDGNLVTNNLVWNNRNGVIVNFGTSTNSQILNNTIVANEGYGIRIGPHSSKAEIVNNIVYLNAIDLDDLGHSTSISTNLIGLDPHFKDTRGPDFSLRKSSPAIDAGTLLTKVSIDFGGIARPSGHGFDIGAFEYVVSATRPSPPTDLRVVTD